MTQCAIEEEQGFRFLTTQHVWIQVESGPSGQAAPARDYETGMRWRQKSFEASRSGLWPPGFTILPSACICWATLHASLGPSVSVISSVKWGLK